MRPKIGREEVIFSRHPQKTTFPPLYGLFENGIIAPRRGLGVHPVMFRGDVQRTGVEMLADLSPAPAAKYANQAANFGAAPSGGSGAAGARAGGIAFGGTSRISFANILSHQRSFHISDLFASAIFSHQRSSPRRHAVRPQGAEGWFAWDQAPARPGMQCHER